MTTEHEVPSFKQCVEVWNAVVVDYAHLDAVLSRQQKIHKAWLSRFFNLVLVRPQTLCRDLKIQTTVRNKDGNLELSEEVFKKIYNRLGPLLLHNNEWQALWKTPGNENDFPLSMIQEWREDWGEEKTWALSSALTAIAPLGLRLSFAVDRASLGREVPDLHLSDLSPVGVSFGEYESLQDHTLLAPFFREGKLEIQDLGSQIMAAFTLWPTEFLPLLSMNGPLHPNPVSSPVLPQLAKRESIRIIDACAGAGGKTLALADLLHGKGNVFAYDVSAVKLKALAKRAQKSGYRNIKTAPIDLEQMETQIKSFKKKGHRVLVDAPCSGWGVLRRNPHMKWQMSATELSELDERLAVIQQKVLASYAQLVEVDGTLIYGACTFRKKETLQHVEWFTKNFPAFQPIGGGFLGPDKGPQGTDGFFMYAWRLR